MEPLLFSFSGIPVAKGRPRAVVRGGFATVYTDSKTRAYERAVGMIAKVAMRGQGLFSGPLSLSVRFRLPLPKSMSRRARATALGAVAHVGTKDLDNLVKAVMDSCNGICWGDDVQVVRLFATKVAAEKPGVDIRIEEFGGA